LPNLSNAAIFTKAFLKKGGSMLEIVLWMIFFAIIRTVVAIIRSVRRMRNAGGEGMCAHCAFAHVQYGATGRKAVFCTYGGAVRPVTIDVLYCTDFRNRNVQIRSVRIGFVTSTDAVEN
jgi:hypothetical protein